MEEGSEEEKEKNKRSGRRRLVEIVGRLRYGARRTWGEQQIHKQEDDKEGKGKTDESEGKLYGQEAVQGEGGKERDTRQEEELGEEWRSR